MEVYDQVSISRICAVLDPVVTPLLKPLGFEEQKPLRWLRSTDAPIRQLFCFHLWKGTVMAPSWGLSLDFVPHVAGSQFKWHRTPKSARLDLCVDARDRNLDISFFHGAEHISARAQPVVSAALCRAGPFWDRARSLHELPRAFEWVKGYLTDGLGFYNYVQHPIAYAFALALNGRILDAMSELDLFFIISRPPEPVKERLRQLLADACLASRLGSMRPPNVTSGTLCGDA